MKESFRQSMAWLHTWTGLLTGWVLFFVFVTGTATYYDNEITRWMQPELPLRQTVEHPPQAEMLEKALDFLARQPDAADTWSILLPRDGTRMGCGLLCRNDDPMRGYHADLRVDWGTGPLGGTHTTRLDNNSGAELAPLPALRATEGGVLFYEMHHALHYIDDGIGRRIVAIFTMLGLLAVVTGVIVHKKIFKDFFTFRPGKGQRSWLDAHNVIGVVTLPFAVMILYSGLAVQGWMPKAPLAVPKPPKPVAQAVAAVPQARYQVTRPLAPMAHIVAQADAVFGAGELRTVLVVRHPDGERTILKLSRPWGAELPLQTAESVLSFDADTGERLDIPVTFGQKPAHQALWWLMGPHNAWFVGTAQRGLFFICGLLSCVVIATGMVLWTVKRREKQLKSGAASFGLRLVERLNIGVLVGLPVGVAAYFWANRLLPVTLFERAEWEVHAMFLTWAWVLLYAVLRPPRKAWLETLWLATAAFALLPALNGLMTDKHLGVTLPHGDWVLAGIDLTMLGLAAVFGLTAWKLQRKWGEPSSRPLTMQGVMA